MTCQREDTKKCRVKKPRESQGPRDRASGAPASVGLTCECSLQLFSYRVMWVGSSTPRHAPHPLPSQATLTVGTCAPLTVLGFGGRHCDSLIFHLEVWPSSAWHVLGADRGSCEVSLGPAPGQQSGVFWVSVRPHCAGFSEQLHKLATSCHLTQWAGAGSLL